MSAEQRRVEFEVVEVKLRDIPVARGWFASAHVLATDVDGRKSQGWIHVEKRGPAMQIAGYDAHDDVDPGLLEYVIVTAGAAILAAVQAKAEAVKIAA